MRVTIPKNEQDLIRRSVIFDPSKVVRLNLNLLFSVLLMFQRDPGSTLLAVVDLEISMDGRTPSAGSALPDFGARNRSHLND
jgi:hypothetical protein